MNASNPRLNGWPEREIRARTGAPNLVSPPAREFLSLASPPARLNVEQTATRLGFKPHDIPILVSRGFLKPLGHPSPNCEKYFARVRILDLESDEEWLSRATDALTQHWRMKNARKTKPTIPAKQC